MQPQPRYGHAAVGVGKKLLVWGGRGGSTKMQSTTVETFDVSSETWEQPQQLRGSALPDDLYGMAVANDGESAYLFGGSTGSAYFNTLYQINLTTLVCRELEPATLSNVPKKKSGSGMVYFKDKLVVYGGYTGLDWTDEVHVFDLRKSECGKGKPCLVCDTWEEEWEGQGALELSLCIVMVFCYL